MNFEKMSKSSLKEMREQIDEALEEKDLTIEQEMETHPERFERLTITDDGTIWEDYAPLFQRNIIIRTDSWNQDRLNGKVFVMSHSGYNEILRRKE